MDFLFDNDHDPLRLIVLFLCLLCIAGLLWRRFNPPNDDWNPKTKDYWFALLMFALTGAATTVESLQNNKDFAPKIVLLITASLVCLRGLRRGGRWRGDGYKDDAAAEDETILPSSDSM